MTASAPHRLHLSSGCGYGPDEVLKVHCANEYRFEDEVLSEPTRLQLEGQPLWGRKQREEPAS